MKYEETGNMNRLIVSYEIESVTKNLPTYKNPGLDSCTSKVYQTFKELIVLFKLFQKNRKGGNTSKLFYEVSIALIPKPDKDTMRK